MNSDIPTINLRCLKQAIKEVAPANRFYCTDESTFMLNDIRISIRGGLLQSEKESFRFKDIRQLILELFHSGYLYCSAEVLYKIKGRYERFVELQSDPAFNRETMKKKIQ